MADFVIPELGENVAAGDVVRILVKPGDMLARDQPVLELETDKATIEVPSSVAGVVQELKVKEGDKVKVGQIVLTVDESASAPAAAPAEADKPAPKAEVPKAEAAPADAPAAEPAPADAPPDPDEAPARTGRVVDISRGAPRPAAAAAAAPSAGGQVPAAPSTRRYARELGLDIGQVPGTGPGGRISADDVKAHARDVILSGGGGAAAAGPLPDFTQFGEVERQGMKAVRRATARHLATAWTAVPHVTQFDKADITNLEALRQKYAKRVEAAGGKLTITAIALKVIAAALRQFPQFNASVDVAAEEIVYKKYVNIGVAVDTDRGLVVPVIRDVDRKNIAELAADLAAAAEKARARKLSPADLEGGCFSISNLGGIGGTFFTPIVNWPEVAILGMSRAVTEPVHVNGQFEPRLLMPLSLSYDHRLIDGADGIRFLRWVCEAFEQPFVLSLLG